MSNKTEIYQLCPHNCYLMHSYLIKTPNDKIIVIDGGHNYYMKKAYLPHAIRAILGLNDGDYFEIFQQRNGADRLARRVPPDGRLERRELRRSSGDARRNGAGDGRNFARRLEAHRAPGNGDGRDSRRPDGGLRLR